MKKLFRSFLFSLLAVSSISLSSSAIRAEDGDGPTILSVKEAGEDYLVQGEYVGVIEQDNGRTWGAQVIALGKGKFHAVGYPGGLPGDGYDRGETPKEADGARDGNKVTFKGDDYSIEIEGDKLSVLGQDGTKFGTLTKVERTSVTMGAKPPEGALVLFDGTSADAWNNGKLTEEKWLAADCSTKEKFNDFQIHLEFRTPFRPNARGQARGNSGLYLQSRYEVQVLDSFGLSGENNECGGIYQIAKPRVNMCYPPLTWQTYDVDFVAAKYDAAGKKTSNAKATIRHNGVVIHQDLDLPKHTPGREEEANSPAPIYLQGHGNPVFYRNIWIVKK